MGQVEETTGSQGQAQAEQSSGKRDLPAPDTSKIDLQALAEHVLRLMKEDARLERERQGRRQP